MKKYLFFLPALLPLFLLTGCEDRGKEKIYDGVEVYHTDKITDEQADAVGNYLVKEKFADGKPKTVQLTKSGDTIQFRMVVKDGVDKDPSYKITMKFFASMLASQVFGGEPLQLQLCDDQLNTLKVVPADDFGKEKDFNGVQIFHTKSITDAEVDSLGSYLVKAKFADGNAKSVMILKPASAYQFKFVVKAGADKDPYYIKNAQVFSTQLSTNVFKGAQVEILMTDPYFTTLATINAADSTKKM